MSPAIVQAIVVIAAVIGFGVVVWISVRALSGLMSPLDGDLS